MQPTHYHHFNPRRIKEPPRRTIFSPRIFLYALAIIVIFIAIFLYKNEIFSNGKNTPEEIKENASLEELSIALASPKDVFGAIRSEDHLLIDIRSEEAYESAHIESSINFSAQQILDDLGQINKELQIMILDEKPSYEGQKLVSELILKGYDAKYLEGGLENYLAKGYTIVSSGDPDSNLDIMKTTPISSSELEERLAKGEIFYYLDTRPKDSIPAMYIKEASRIPLEELEAKTRELPHGKIVIFDENSKRSYQAAVRLFDMNVLGVYYFSDDIASFVKIVK